MRAICTGGEKFWHHVKRGVPIRIEVGPRDIATDSLFVSLRDKPIHKYSQKRLEFIDEIDPVISKNATTVV